MNLKRTLALIRVALEHDLERLEPRAGLDELGNKLAHEVRGLLATLEFWKVAPPSIDELTDEVRSLSNRTSDVRERITDYLTGRRRARVENLLPDATRPSPEIVAQIRYAQSGPDSGPEAETLEACPACRHCTLCGDRRFVPVSTASEWRSRNLPRRQR